MASSLQFNHPTGLMCPIERLELEMKWKIQLNREYSIKSNSQAKTLTRINRQLIQFEWIEMSRQFCEEPHFQQKEFPEFPVRAIELEDCL